MKTKEEHEELVEAVAEMLAVTHFSAICASFGVADVKKAGRVVAEKSRERRGMFNGQAEEMIRLIENH